MEMSTLLSVVPIIVSVFKDSDCYIINMESNKEIISRLKFIGKIQKGEKINVKYVYVQPEGIGTSISRTLLYPDNKGNTLKFVEEVISRSFKILENATNSHSDKVMCENLLEDLAQAIIGLNNLKETYTTNVKFCCDMDTQMQIIESKLSEINAKSKIRDDK